MELGGLILGLVLGFIAFVLLLRVLYRIFVVDKKAQKERIETENIRGITKGTEAETNASVFDSGVLAELEEEGPEAWFIDVEDPSPRIQKSLKLGQTYISMPVKGIAVTNYPLPLQQRCAFSIKFVSGVEGNGTCAVGLSWRPPPKAIPGHFIRSVGLQNDGFVYSGQPDVWRRTFNGSFQDGDTITVLVDRINGSVKWLKNGKFVIDAQQMTDDVPVNSKLPALTLEKGWVTNAAIFPAFGLHGAAVVEMYFGKEGKPFPGLEEYGDDELVFGRGDCPAGIEEALQEHDPKSTAKKTFKRSLSRSATRTLPTKVLEESSSTVQERFAKLRALRLTQRSKRMAISEASDRLQDRFRTALEKKGIDRDEFLSPKCSLTSGQNDSQDARSSGLRDVSAAFDVKAALNVKLDRCRFQGCECTALVLQEIKKGDPPHDYSSVRCKCCGHAMSYHKQLPGRRFNSIAQLEDGQERACELLSYSKSAPAWRRITDIDGETKYYNIDTGEILNAECPDTMVTATLELTRPNAERRKRVESEGRKERPKRTRPIHTWYIEEKMSPKSVKSGRREALRGRNKLQEVVMAVSSPRSPKSPKSTKGWGDGTKRNKLGALGAVASAMMDRSKTMDQSKTDTKPSEIATTETKRSTTPSPGEIEALKSKAEPFMNEWQKGAPMSMREALGAPAEQTKDDNNV